MPGVFQAYNERGGRTLSTVLKPCPFCGCVAGLTKEKIGYMKWITGCTTESCRGYWRESPLYDNPEEAVEAWNRRANDENA